MLVDPEVAFPEALEIIETTSIEGSGVADGCWNCRTLVQFFQYPSLNFYGQKPARPSSSDLLRLPLNPLDAVDADS